MNTEAQRVAIATVCGYEHINQKCWRGHRRGIEVRIPDFCNSLDAMHEAEKVLFLQDYGPLYGEWLEGNWHATAAQRAEAFLRTLGLWIES